MYTHVYIYACMCMYTYVHTQVNTGKSTFISLHLTNIYGKYKVLCQCELLPLVGFAFISNLKRCFGTPCNIWSCHSTHLTNIYGNYKVLCQCELLPLCWLLLLFITWKNFLVLFIIYDHAIKLITTSAVKKKKKSHPGYLFIHYSQLQLGS